MAMDRHTYVLPNGLSIYHNNDYETDYVYQEIFVENIYLQHGITLNENATVFDVGANIGIFSLFLKQHYSSVEIHAFEPSQDIYQLLKLNTEKYKNDIHVHNLGLSDTDMMCDFYYYPQFSVISGFKANPDRDAEIILEGARTGDKENDEQVISLIKQRLSDIVISPCPMKTISTIIQQQHINQIDLLKIDAEGSELAILNGIKKSDWPKIKQIVMEVHNKEEFPMIQKVLDNYGFSVIIESDKRLKSAHINNLYAICQV